MAASLTSRDVRSSASALGAEADLQRDGLVRHLLLRRLMDVVALPASRGSIQDRAIAGDLLLEILLESDVAARELCARRLQEMSQAPKRLLRFLALDAPHVAQLIIANNRAFDDADLCHIIEHGGPSHRYAVAHRRDVGPSAASAIAASGDLPAIRALLENPQARLSDRAVDLIVTASREASALPPLLIQREELRPAHALAMFWWSGPAERKQILMRFAAERTFLIEMCGDVLRFASRERDPAVRKALQVVERRQRDRAAIDRSAFSSLEDAVEALAITGMTPETCVDIAALAGVRTSTAEQIFKDLGGEGVAVLCKATGLRRAYLRHLWRALGRDDESDDFARVSELYETIAVAKAQTVLRYWNWSLSSAFSPDDLLPAEQDGDTNAASHGAVADVGRAPMAHRM